MVKFINKLKNRKGFTLIELIVVLAVLAVIMAIAVPRFLGVQEEAKLNADYSTGALLTKAAELYLVDDTHTIAQINTEAAKGAAALATLLKMTDIEFTSKDFKGQEATIVFSEVNSSVVVKATAVAGGALGAGEKQLYPK